MNNEDIVLFNKTNKNKKEIDTLKMTIWGINGAISSLNNTHYYDTLNINNSINSINDSILELQNNGGGSGGSNTDTTFSVNEYYNDWVPKQPSPNYPQSYFATSEDINATYSDYEPILTGCSYDHELDQLMIGKQNGVLTLSLLPNTSGKFTSVYRTGARVIESPILTTDFISKASFQNNTLETVDHGTFFYYIGISDTTDPSTSDVFIGFVFILNHTGITVHALSKKSPDSSESQIDTSTIPFFHFKNNNKYRILIEGKTTVSFYINDVLCAYHDIENLFLEGDSFDEFLYIYSLNVDTASTQGNGSPANGIDVTYIKETQER